MINSELAAKIRTIRIYTNKAVNDILAGEYESVFKGRGMEFDEVRAYQPGDDIRTIDWNVTARTGHPYVKQYVEERELTIFFLVDLSASGAFGSEQRLKNEVAAELCALLAFSAIKNNDKVGLIAFTDTVEMFIPPKKGTTHVLRLIREILSFSPERGGTNIAASLHFFGRISRKRSVAFLVSDFIDQDFFIPMRIIARRHDLIAVSITDPRELELPAAGLIELEDAETGKRLMIDSSSPVVRRAFAAAAARRLNDLAGQFAAMGVDHVPLQTNQDYVLDLVRFFRMRERRRR
ncbi:MAG: DUF58 domain-containing protein [Proteobacteria bacterium]|nr:DUF58 domain-containing protein [Pseudomonadota bacterium]MBU4294577.1 DUF58 domain-containing protein [Pseudomonadota bacterium]MCG2747113.1 DUF58 domain-containing protein [Desulfobulbaceae bacterium]